MKKVVKGAVMINGKSFILPSSMKGKGHYLPILEKTVEQLDAMLTHHSKVLVVRLDLRTSGEHEDNEEMSKFIRRLRKWLVMQKHTRLGYIWCREQDTSAHPHYHLALILNANITQNPKYLRDKVDYLWQEFGLGSVWQPKAYYMKIHRSTLDGYLECFHRLSYLAKVHTKQCRNPAVNDYSASRIKPKQ